MQGRERNRLDIDKQFTNEAWENMQSMLDKEMPVSPTTTSSKRNYGLLLLFLLVGFLSGIGTTMWWGSDQAEETPTPKPVQQPVISTPQQPLASIPLPVESSSEENLQTVHGGGGVIPTKPVVIPAPTLKTLAPDVIEFEDQQSFALARPARTSVESDQVIISALSKETNEKTGTVANITSKPITTLAATNESQEMLASWVTSPMLSKENSLLEENEIPATLERLVFLPKSRKWNFGVYLGTHSQRFSALDGLSAELIASYQLDRKFAVQSGIRYSILTSFTGALKSSEDLNGAFSFTNPDQEEDYLSQYSTVDPAGNRANLPISRLDYLEIPIRLQFQPSRKLRVNMGAKLGYLMQASKSRRLFEANFDRDQSEAVDHLLMKSLNRFDLATVLGVAFYPIPRLGIGIRYNHGFVDYTIDKKWNRRQLNINKSFELGISYFLR